MHDCLEEHGLKFISRLRTRPPAITDNLKEGVIHYDMDYNAAGDDVCLDKVVFKGEAESWLITMPSKKQIEQTETGIEDEGIGRCTTRTSIRRSSVVWKSEDGTSRDGR
ncbi:hypothetical protein [Halopiger aswanensis]|uniref:hypothetical protein n=1 Tax=Halopiger aswanensis TaxID=148449 RepID=UPI001472E86B|nr:hypothetical protein [Halopiger aswanensis]